VAAAYVQVSPTGAAKGRRGRLCATCKHPGHPEKSGWLVLFPTDAYHMKRAKIIFCLVVLALNQVTGQEPAAPSIASGALKPLFRITKGWVITFKANGTLILWHHGWLDNEEHRITFSNGQWFVTFGPQDIRRIDITMQPSPIEQPSAHLGPNGQVFWWRQQGDITETHPAKVVQREWCYYASGEWIPFMGD